MFILEIIFEVIFQIVLVFPGAFVRWVFGGFKRTYRDVLIQDGFEINSFVGILVLAGAVLLYIYLC
jgi:hypothetical protein